ncbi:UNVERIFIED_ORG: transposase [Paraburkholderia sediminicola]|nr:transposase [Paraburkholderia sediminicola]
MGHHVQIIAPRFVKPYVKSQKNDRNDAEAITDAVSRPTMRYVAINSVEQQDIQSMHRIRSLLMRDRIAQINQIRGLLAEYGVVIAQTPLKVRQQLPAILDDPDNELTALTRSMMHDMYERLTLLDTQIARYDDLILHAHMASALSQRLEKIRGVGPMIATAVIAAAGSATEFANGRQFAAWLGLTPRQHSSGGRQRLFGITKRGNGYWPSACPRCPMKARCSPSDSRRIRRWEHEHLLEAMQRRLDREPDAMTIRRSTVEHVFGTLKHWMGPAHFLTRTLRRVSTEMSLQVLAYNLKRVMNILGVAGTMKAMKMARS